MLRKFLLKGQAEEGFLNLEKHETLKYRKCGKILQNTEKEKRNVEFWWEADSPLLKP